MLLENQKIMTRNSDHSIHLNSENIENLILQPGNHNSAEINSEKVNLPQPNMVNIAQELLEIRQSLRQLDSENRQKIENALEDAEEEIQKEHPDKDEVGKALSRALDYAQKTQGFVEIADKLRPHITKTVGWLGRNWHKLLIVVGLAG